MTDAVPPTSPPPQPWSPPPQHARAPAAEPWTRKKLDAYFRGAVFVILLVVAAIATLRAYIALENAILTWLRPQFVPLAQAGFSLVILAIVVWLIRAWVIARADE